MRRVLRALALAATMLWPATARTAAFENTYMTFDLPDGWTCQLEETEHICNDTAVSGPAPSIIIMAAKFKGEDDRLDRYEDHLSTPRPVMDRNGLPTGRSSRVIEVRTQDISGQSWVRARHFESELPEFYTDYLATVGERVAILVTFSAHRSVFQNALERFWPSMATIRPKR